MSGLVGYHYDDSDDESRRNSIGNEENLPSVQKTVPPVSTSSSDDTEPMVVDSPNDPEPSKSEEEPKRPAPRKGTPPPASSSRVPFVGSYAEQFKRKATPVNVDQAVIDKYAEMFRRKAMGVDLNSVLEDSRALRNPCLYDVLMDKFDVDSTGSNVPKCARVFNWDDFTVVDFYRNLLYLQEDAHSTATRSKKHGH